MSFILPYTIGNYLADEISTGPIPVDSDEFVDAEESVQRIDTLCQLKGKIGRLFS